jgi:hypothetical protein
MISSRYLTAQQQHKAQNRPQFSASPGRLRWPPGSDTDIVASKGQPMALGILQARESPPGPPAQGSDIITDLDATGQLSV